MFDVDGIPHSFLQLTGLQPLHASTNGSAQREADSPSDCSLIMSQPNTSDRLNLAVRVCTSQMKIVQEKQVQMMQQIVIAREGKTAARQERLSAANVIWNSHMIALRNLRRLLALRMAR